MELLRVSADTSFINKIPHIEQSPSIPRFLCITTPKMPCTISAIFFISDIAETSQNATKITYDVYTVSDEEEYYQAKLIAFQASTPTTNTVRIRDSIFCSGRCYYDTTRSQLVVRKYSITLSFFECRNLHITFLGYRQSL